MERIVGDLLRTRADAAGGSAYIKCGKDWVTLGELDLRSERIAGGLADIGVKRGDRVAILLPNSEELIGLIFGAAKVGAIQVPLNYWLKGAFLQYQLADCGASVLVTDRAGFDSAAPLLGGTGVDRVVLLEPVDEPDGTSTTIVSFEEMCGSGSSAPTVRLSPGDVLSLSYTSGTTGLPKGCMLSHGYYTAIPGTYRDAGFFVRGDRLFSAFPLFHMSGVMSFMSPLVIGGSAVFDLAFSASTHMSRAAAEGATVLWGVGSMGLAILATPPAPSDPEPGFRLAMWVPMHPTKQIEFENRFNTPVTSELYGQTECSPTTISAVDGVRKRDSAGPAGSHVEVRIVDDHDFEVPTGEVGEIVVRPKEPYVMYSGYWGKGDATTETWRNLWHHTGDYGRADDDHFIYFVDRKKDALRRRGENVSSLELEMILMKHPSIATAAVCGVPSPLGEDDIKASIVWHAGAAASPEELFDYFKAVLPYFAIPRYVDVRDSLPTTTIGKVMKNVLRDEGVTVSMWDFDALGLTVARSDRR